jgi:hypothetical protein
MFFAAAKNIPDVFFRIWFSVQGFNVQRSPFPSRQDRDSPVSRTANLEL